MSIEYRVPLIGQRSAHLCWLAVFDMLEGWYNTVQPRRATAFDPNQIQHLVALDWGVQPNSIDAFGNMMGLTTKVGQPNAQSVETLLRTYGPLWYPARNVGYLPIGDFHVVLIRGIDGLNILFNDPSPVGIGSDHRMPVAEFFNRLSPMGNRFLVMLAGSSPDKQAILTEPALR